MVQALVVLLSLGLAELIARIVQLGHAGGVLCLASLATVVVSARLGWQQAMAGVAGLALLSVPAVFSNSDPQLASIVLTVAAIGLGLSVRWQMKPVFWLLMVSLCILITNSPLPAAPSGLEAIRLALALLATGGVAALLQSLLVPHAPRPATAVANSWRRSMAHAGMLAAATLVSTPIALEHHWHTTGLWLILTPFLVLQPFVRESWTVAVHRCLGTLAGVLLVIAVGLLVPRGIPLELPAIAAGVLTVVIAARHGHRALMLTAFTATIVLFNSSHEDLLLMADQRVLASALGIAIALSAMALALPIERRFARARRSIGPGA